MSLFKSEIDHPLFFSDDDIYVNFDRFDVVKDSMCVSY